jgi:Protein of unknown function, DUF
VTERQLSRDHQPGCPAQPDGGDGLHMPLDSQTKKRILDLASGSTPPQTGLEKHFVRVCQGLSAPCTDIEREWFFYLKDQTQIPRKDINEVSKDADANSIALPRLSDAIAQINKDLTERWWGFGHDFGWIVLDRSENKGKEFRTFYCLKNSEAVTIPFEEWGKPNFLYAVEKLSNAPPQSQLKLLEDFWTSRTRFLSAESERQTLEDDGIRKKGNLVLKAHKRFIKRLRNVPFLGARESNGKYSYESHCYKCHQHLDGAINYQCVRCGWLICPRQDCGACGCGHILK